MPFGRSAKRRRISPPSDNKTTQSKTIKSKNLFHHAAEWDLEQGYEQQRKLKSNKETTKLPIKTAEGRIEQQVEGLPYRDGTDSLLSDDGESDGERADTPPTEDSLEHPRVVPKSRILEAKEVLARLAGLVVEDPEAHAGSFKKIAHYASPTTHPSIRKLALATQLAVYKDLIPDYRIRAYKDEDLGTKVSKDVRQTRQYEQALVTGYQHYVENLSSIAKAATDTEETSSEKLVAVNCVCALLLAVPHFNFRTELLKTLVDQLSSRRQTPLFAKCLETLRTYFQEDDDGASSLEAVGLLTKMMKARNFRIQERVLNAFFHLRLLSEMSFKGTGSDSKSDQSEEIARYRGKKIKAKWEPRSKKERKVARERKAVAKDVKEADAIVTHESRDRMQSEALQMVFATYFRILKLRIGNLTGAVLEGLAQFAHLINQDLFGDLLEALKDIIQENAVSDDSEVDEFEPGVIRNSERESLLSTQTAFTLLSGQDVSKSASALHLDLSFFVSHVYETLYQLSVDADIERAPKASGALSDSCGNVVAPKTQYKVNVLTPMLLLLRVLNSILVTPASPPPTGTALAYYKRLLTTSLQLPEKSLQALLSLLAKVAHRHGRKIEALWYSDERKGDGVFNGESESIAGTNTLALGSGVWEAELLRHHFSPRVRKEVLDIDKIIQGLNR